MRLQLRASARMPTAWAAPVPLAAARACVSTRRSASDSLLLSLRARHACAEIVKKLGKGSYAVVFAARKRDDGQLYALKVRAGRPGGACLKRSDGTCCEQAHARKLAWVLQALPGSNQSGWAPNRSWAPKPEMPASGLARWQTLRSWARWSRPTL